MSDVSIIIPTRNRALTLATTLYSIASVIRSSHKIEIVIVDNGSTDHTAQICAHIAESFPRLEWRYFYDSMPGLLTGRHRGAKEARGDVLAYLDDDVLLSPTWVEGLEEAFSDPNVALVGGPSPAAFERNPPCWLRGFWTEFEEGRRCEWLSLIECGDAIKPIDPIYIWGLNFSIRKNKLLQCGGFHPDCIPPKLQRYQGDGESGLALKIKSAGLSCLYHPGVALRHIIPASRLTPVSFEQRGFYRGVCASFAQIRRDGRVPAMPQRSWKDLLRPAKWKLERKAILCKPTTEGVLRLAARAHVAGVKFHENEVRRDAKLLDWVLRPNYFDYRLPDGWEGYLSA